MSIGARQLLAVLALVAALGRPAAAAPVVPIDAALGETVVDVMSRRALPVYLETTLFLPPGNGPFPVVLVNHGKEAGDNRLQPRYRPLPAVREFLQRGYAVVVPMRQGFSNSGGRAVSEGCDIAGSGAAQAEDIGAVVAWLTRQPWADTGRMVMMGQSHGGLATLAYARNPHPGFKLFVNFAGGLRSSSDGCRWQRALNDAFARYGAATRVPSLWFYGRNDSLFPPEVIDPAHAAYVAAGAPAELVAYGDFGADAHAMFSSSRGVSIWWPKVESSLARAKLPLNVVHPRFAVPPPMAVPAATNFAAVDDLTRLPFVRNGGREAYAIFLGKPAQQRAFAVAPGGHWGWASGGDDPLRRALESCQSQGKSVCRLYAVDGHVVWSE